MGNVKTGKETNNTRIRIGIPQAPGIIILIFGVVALIASIASSSSILALIGLGLTFCGAVLLYIQNQDYTPTKILDASITPLTETLTQTIRAFGYEGNPVYLPPKYVENPEDTKIFIPKQKNGSYPTPEQTQQTKDQPIIINPEGLLLTPPGADLAKLFEKTLETTFTRVDLEFLRQHLPNLLIEDLEIATDVEIENKTLETHQPLDAKSEPSQNKPEINTIILKMTTITYQNTLLQDTLQPEGIGSPLISAIACAMTKATGKLTTITKKETSQDGRKTTVEFQLEETGPPP